MILFQLPGELHHLRMNLYDNIKFYMEHTSRIMV